MRAPLLQVHSALAVKTNEMALLATFSKCNCSNAERPRPNSHTCNAPQPQALPTLAISAPLGHPAATCLSHKVVLMAWQEDLEGLCIILGRLAPLSAPAFQILRA